MHFNQQPVIFILLLYQCALVSTVFVEVLYKMILPQSAMLLLYTFVAGVCSCKMQNWHKRQFQVSFA